MPKGTFLERSSIAMEPPLNEQKRSFRYKLKKRRKAIPQKRRSETVQALLSIPFASHGPILSFAPFKDEINTTSLNLHLAHTARLLLPRMEGGNLKIYRVTDLKKQLKTNAFGLLEPIISQCVEVLITQIKTLLVPALGFDKNNHRIGYGKGYYDRLLKRISHCPTIGIGFKEQLVNSLPLEKTDVALTKLILL